MATCRMALSARANVPSRLRSKTTARPARIALTRAASQDEEPRLAVANIALSAAAVLLSVTAYANAAVSVENAAAEVTSTAPAQSERASTATSISFARVDMKVTQKLRERDENMTWKCKGQNMYDCDGELAEAAEKRFEEMANLFRAPSQ